MKSAAKLQLTPTNLVVYQGVSVNRRLCMTGPMSTSALPDQEKQEEP